MSSATPPAARGRLAEAEARERVRRRIEHERSLGRAYVGVLLDDLCRHYGWDPARVWRGRAADELRAAARARLIERQHPQHPEFIGRHP